LRDDELLAEFEALPSYMSDSDINDGESESEVNDSDAGDISDSYKMFHFKAPRNAQKEDEQPIP
jgi:hypothetical protein